MSRLTDLQTQLRKRKRNRERKRRLKQGSRARREAGAVRSLRRRIRHLIRLAASPTVMFDAVTVSNIPSGARAVAGYVNGAFTTFPKLKVLFPHARRLSIAVNSSADADILDIERGDATIADAVGWYRRKSTNRGFYIGAAEANQLINALAAASIHRDDYLLWTAHWDGEHICGPGSCGVVSSDADGTQWTTHNETVDESKLKRGFFIKRDSLQNR